MNDIREFMFCVCGGGIGILIGQFFALHGYNTALAGIFLLILGFACLILLPRE